MPYEPKSNERTSERDEAARKRAETERGREERARAGRSHDWEGDKPEPARHPGLEGDAYGR